MKISIYTTLITHEKGYFIYNSFSNSLAKIDKDLFLKLESFKNKDFSEQDLNEDADTVKSLRNAFIITDNPKNDLLQYQATTWGRRRVDDVYNITIAPTMDCNYNCYYCFEEQVKEYMSDEIIERIAKYMNSLPNKCRLNFTWFGGEPLLAFEQMKKLNQSLSMPEDIDTDYCIITNGYYMNEAVIDELHNLHIKTIQLSIDGLYEDYNQVKCMKNDKRCFDTILKNIDYFAAKHKDIAMHIRVNMDNNTKDDFLNIVHFFYQRYPENQNIKPYAAFLKNIGNATPESCACDFSSGTDKMQFALDMFQKTNNKYFLYPQNNFSECAVRNHNSWAFGPDGSVYKCWENIGNRENKVGFIDENGYIQITDNLKLTRYMYGADPLCNEDCRGCFYLPICYGGCPHQRILEEFENAPIQQCAKDCGYIEQYITALINATP